MGLETGFTRVLPTGRRNIGRNPVSEVSSHGAKNRVYTSFAHRKEKYRKKPGF